MGSLTSLVRAHAETLPYTSPGADPPQPPTPTVAAAASGGNRQHQRRLTRTQALTSILPYGSMHIIPIIIAYARSPEYVAILNAHYIETHAFRHSSVFLWSPHDDDDDDHQDNNAGHRPNTLLMAMPFVIPDLDDEGHRVTDRLWPWAPSVVDDTLCMTITSSRSSSRSFVRMPQVWHQIQANTNGPHSRGTGKVLMHHHDHESSSRHGTPSVVVDAAAAAAAAAATAAAAAVVASDVIREDCPSLETFGRHSVEITIHIDMDMTMGADDMDMDTRQKQPPPRAQQKRVPVNVWFNARPGDATQCYSPLHKRWFSLPSSPRYTVTYGMVAYHHRVFVMGQESESYKDEDRPLFQVYDTIENRWYLLNVVAAGLPSTVVLDPYRWIATAQYGIIGFSDDLQQTIYSITNIRPSRKRGSLSSGSPVPTLDCTVTSLPSWSWSRSASRHQHDYDHDDENDFTIANAQFITMGNGTTIVGQFHDRRPRPNHRSNTITVPVVAASATTAAIATADRTVDDDSTENATPTTLTTTTRTTGETRLIWMDTVHQPGVWHHGPIVPLSQTHGYIGQMFTISMPSAT